LESIRYAVHLSICAVCSGLPELSLAPKTASKLPHSTRFAPVPSSIDIMDSNNEPTSFTDANDFWPTVSAAERNAFSLFIAVERCYRQPQKLGIERLIARSELLLAIVRRIMACLGSLFMNDIEPIPDPKRREFLKTSSLATLMALMGGVELRAEDAAKPASSGTALTKEPDPPSVNFGVIGLNEWGREILHQLSLMPYAPVVAICDNYSHAFRKAAEEAPKAKQYADYKELLADPNVQAVVIATPTGTHREIALAAIAANKHVYCEAPLANTIDDAKAIAKAARDAVKIVFQPGLQERSHPQRHFLIPFIRGGALGKDVMARAQWHKHDSWRRESPNEERAAALNWRLHQKTSTGLIGEEGVHQIDVASWFLRNRPVAVTGFSAMRLWGEDGRDVPDTVQAVYEFPHSINCLYDATLCSSFDGAYEMYYGTDSTIMCRDSKAWQFKEAGSALQGWEVYARKDTFYKESGIMLVASGSHQSALVGNAASSDPYDHTPVWYALDAFVRNVSLVGGTVKDFTDLYGDSADPKDLAEKLKALITRPAATWREGLDATVMAIAGNEAAVKKQKIAFQNEWFEL
jgi:predicted dehydrogenase